MLKANSNFWYLSNFRKFDYLLIISEKNIKLKNNQSKDKIIFYIK